MDLENLIHMANRIGDFFQALPDRAEAETGIADHLKKFWDPRMRRQIYAALDAGECAALHEIVRAALQDHRGRLEPVAKAST
jgi:formate dehydrogenase subunit delta